MQHSTMHRALTIPEILSSILQSANKQTAVECARVNKLWSDIALDRLWYSLEAAEPLFLILYPELLPFFLKYGDYMGCETYFGSGEITSDGYDHSDYDGDSDDSSDDDTDDSDDEADVASNHSVDDTSDSVDDNESGADIDDSEISSSDSPLPDFTKSDGWYKEVDLKKPLEWDRFFYYANRVREFHFPHGNRKQWDRMGIMSKRCPSPCLLPRLRLIDLEIGPDNRHHVSYITKFFSHSTTTITIRADLTAFWDPLEEEMCVELETALIDIAARTPSVTKLSLLFNRDIMEEESVEDGLTSLLAQFSKLEELQVAWSTVTPDVIQAVRGQPLLKHLALVDLPEGPPQFLDNRWPAVIGGSSVDNFPSLTNLSTQWSGESCEIAMTALESNELHSRIKFLCCSVFGDLSETEIGKQALFTAINSYKQLESLEVDFVARDNDTHLEICPLRLIVGMPNLVSIDVKLVTSGSIKDEDIQLLVRNCPRLERMRLIPIENKNTTQEQQLPSIGALALLSNEPNMLRSLELRIIAPIDLKVPEKADIGDHLKRLEVMDFEYSRIDNCDVVNLQMLAEFLKHCLSPVCRHASGKKITSRSGWMFGDESLGSLYGSSEEVNEMLEVWDWVLMG